MALDPNEEMTMTYTSVIAWYGFFAEYLLKSNGVVLLLWIAHIFLVAEISIIHLFMKRKIH